MIAWRIPWRVRRPGTISLPDERFVQDRDGFGPYSARMHMSPFRTVLIVSLLAGTATALVGQDQLEKYRTQMANMGAQAPTTPQDGVIAATIAQWRALQTDRRAAVRQLCGLRDGASRLAWRGREPPRGGTSGKYCFAE